MTRAARAAVTALSTLVLLVLAAAPASAAPVKVFDDTGLLDRAAVTAAAEKVGRVTFVVVLPDEDEDLDERVTFLGFTPRSFPADTVVLGIHPADREVKVYTPFDSLTQLDQGTILDAMTPQLQAGDWTGAAVAGIDEVHAQLNPSRLWLWIALGAGAVVVIWAVLAMMLRARRGEPVRGPAPTGPAPDPDREPQDPRDPREEGAAGWRWDGRTSVSWSNTGTPEGRRHARGSRGAPTRREDEGRTF